MPVRVKYEPLEASVLILTLLLFPGVKVAAPDALKLCPVGIKAPPESVARPETSRVDSKVVAPVTCKISLNVVAPVTPKVSLRVVAPVTPKVVETEALFNVASPEVAKLLSVVLPVTFKVLLRNVWSFTANVPLTVA